MIIASRGVSVPCGVDVSPAWDSRYPPVQRVSVDPIVQFFCMVTSGRGPPLSSGDGGVTAQAQAAGRAAAPRDGDLGGRGAQLHGPGRAAGARASRPE